MTCSTETVEPPPAAPAVEVAAAVLPPDAPPAAADPAPMAAPEAVPTPAPAPVAETPPDSPNPDRDRGERIAQAQMKLIADMVYKPFYEEVPMDAATRAAATELFTEAFGKQQQVQQQAMFKGDRSATEVKAETDALRDELRQKLSGVLDDKQLAAWEEYDAYSDRVLFEALLDGQLRMLAPDLSIDSHQRSIAVFAEELERAINGFESSDQTYNLDNFNEAQYAGLVAALQRLRFELDAEQYGHAQGFADQAKAMFDAMKNQPAPP